MASTMAVSGEEVPRPPSARVIWNDSCRKLGRQNKFKILDFSKEQYNSLSEEVRAGLTRRMEIFSRDKAIWVRDGGNAQNWVLGPFKKMMDHLIEYNEVTIFDPHRQFNVTTLYEKVPRPPNAFILYRKDRHKELKNANPTLKNNEISTLVGTMWRREDDATRAKYHLKAQECKNMLLKYYPQYKYKPRRPDEPLAESPSAARSPPQAPPEGRRRHRSVDPSDALLLQFHDRWRVLEMHDPDGVAGDALLAMRCWRWLAMALILAFSGRIEMWASRPARLTCSQLPALMCGASRAAGVTCSNCRRCIADRRGTEHTEHAGRWRVLIDAALQRWRLTCQPGEF